MSINPFSNISSKGIFISFNSLDKNNDGKITEDEFKKLSSICDIKFEDIDDNGDLVIDDDDFSNFEDIMNEQIEESEQAEAKTGAGADYTVDLSAIDTISKKMVGFNTSSAKVDLGYSSISDMEEEAAKGKAKEKALANIKNTARGALGQEWIKNIIKSELTTMLESRGLSFSDIESVFDNVYADSIDDTVNMDIYKVSASVGKDFFNGNRKFAQANASFDKNTLVTNLIMNFNKNITKTVDSLGSSETDMDLSDIDYTQAGTNDRMKKAISTNTNYPSVGTIEAEMMLWNMKSEMENKARNMCTRNGIEFNSDTFSKYYKNSLDLALKTVDNHNFNPRSALNALTENFKTTYTQWVEIEKNKTR